MTPKEKAKELYNKFIPFTDTDINDSKVEVYNTKQCVLIAVDEIVEAIEWHEYETPNKEIRFWIEVKQYIIEI